MRTLLRRAGPGLMALACGVLLVGIRGQAGEEKKIAAAIQKIADLHAKGGEAAAKAQAKALAKTVDDVGDVMEVLKPRKKGGFGVGPKAEAIRPDGIEQMVMALSRDGITAGKLSKHAEDLEQMAYRTAAIMDVALAKVPEKDEGTKTRKLWTESATQAHAAALELARAAHAKGPADVQKVARRLNDACTNCHSEFRQ